MHLLKVRAGNGWMVGQFKQVTPSTKKQANQGKSISLCEKTASKGPTVNRLMWVVKGPEKNQELHRNRGRGRVSTEQQGKQALMLFCSGKI